MRWFAVVVFALAALRYNAIGPPSAGGAPTVQGKTAAPVDQSIPWSEVIFDTRGKKVLPFDPKNEVGQRVVKSISAAYDETMKQLNAPDSAIKISRVSTK